MCFVNDCDWYAGIMTDEQRVSDKPFTCEECRRKFPAGTERRAIWMQEHEECHACYEGDCECPRDEDEWDHECKCETPAYGETFECDICLDCNRMLQAIKAAEIEAGCDASESQPAFGMMVEQVSDGDIGEARKYVQKARQMFPDLATSGYLGWFWRQMHWVETARKE